MVKVLETGSLGPEIGSVVSIESFGKTLRIQPRGAQLER